jgi:hypothetical protein
MSVKFGMILKVSPGIGQTLRNSADTYGMPSTTLSGVVFLPSVTGGTSPSPMVDIFAANDAVAIFTLQDAVKKNPKNPQNPEIEQLFVKVVNEKSISVLA